MDDEAINMCVERYMIFNAMCARYVEATGNDLLKVTGCSDIRRGVLLNLIDGKKSLRELREALNTSSTTALHAIRELERVKLIYRDEMHEYELTETGRIIAKKILDIADTSEVLKKHERFWAEHDLSGIPENLLEKIGWLKKSEVVRLDALDILKTHKIYVKYLQQAKWVKGVSPIFAPDYPSIFKELLSRGAPIQLVLTREVMEKVLRYIRKEELKSAIKSCCIELYVIHDVKVAFTVADTFLSLGLFTKEGIYDTTSDLISVDQKAIQWGVLLFNHYKEMAKRYVTEC